MLHCGFTLPRFRKQEATYKWKCSAAEISKERVLSKSLKGIFALNINFPCVGNFLFFYVKNHFGDY